MCSIAGFVCFASTVVVGLWVDLVGMVAVLLFRFPCDVVMWDLLDSDVLALCMLVRWFIG